jgi:hypothetical protein
MNKVQVVNITGVLVQFTITETNELVGYETIFVPKKYPAHSLSLAIAFAKTMLMDMYGIQENGVDNDDSEEAA